MGMSTLQQMVKAACVGLVLACGLSVSSVLAQDLEIVVGERVTDMTGQVHIDWMSPQALMVAQQQAFFIDIPPSVTGLNTPDVISDRTGLLFECVNQFTGQLIPFCDLTFTLDRTPFSAGHDHDDVSRPVGEFIPPAGNSGSDGILETDYIAPDVSGVVTLTVTGVEPSGQPVLSATAAIAVRVLGLQDLGPGANYNLIGAVPGIHTDNHYGTPAFNSKLVTVANIYAAAFPSFKLDLNDMSLVQGGLFDLNANWMPSHRTHRFGVNLDLRSKTIPQSQRNTLKQIITNAGIRKTLEEKNPPHWHLTE